jgi:hypothetical protein
MGCLADELYFAPDVGFKDLDLSQNTPVLVCRVRSRVKSSSAVIKREMPDEPKLGRQIPGGDSRNPKVARRKNETGATNGFVVAFDECDAGAVCRRGKDSVGSGRGITRVRDRRRGPSRFCAARETGCLGKIQVADTAHSVPVLLR